MPIRGSTGKVPTRASLTPCRSIPTLERLLLWAQGLCETSMCVHALNPWPCHIESTMGPFPFKLLIPTTTYPYERYYPNIFLFTFSACRGGYNWKHRIDNKERTSREPNPLPTSQQPKQNKKYINYVPSEWTSVRILNKQTLSYDSQFPIPHLHSTLLT